MSGADVPYHLRPNKFVDRQLFVDMLSRIDQIRSMSGYVYVSMAGKFLEDHRALRMNVDVKGMVSIESAEHILNRQNFNKPFECIELLNKTSSDFVSTFSDFASHNFPDDNFIVWLDFTAPLERLVQLQEFESLISYSQPYDIFRITLNANVETLVSEQRRLPDNMPTVRDWRVAAYNSALSQFPANPKPEEMIRERFPSVLARSVSAAARKGIRSQKGHVVRPLGIFSYNDGNHTMLSCTCIALPQQDADEFLGASAVSAWPFLAKAWDDVRSIDVPDLSTKEKWHIDHLLLTKTDAEIAASLGFNFDEAGVSSTYRIQQYREHYRFYPHFVRVGT